MQQAKSGEPAEMAQTSWRQRLQRSVGQVRWRQIMSLPQILDKNVEPYWPHFVRTKEISVSQTSFCWRR